MKSSTMAICLLVLAFLISFQSPAEALNDYTGWANKVKININNPTTTSLTVPANYPVKISVPAKTYIDAGKMNSDMRDIRFADSNGYPLPFWINITENMTRTFNNISVYVRLRTFNAGDNVIYMYFDSSKVKGNKSPQADFTTSDTTYCGDGGTTSVVPYSNETCGDNTFSLFAFDCTKSDWKQDSSCTANSNKKWVSVSSFGTGSNATALHFRTHFYINKVNLSAYFLTQVSGTLNQSNIDTYAGYKLLYTAGTPSTAADTYNMDNNTLQLQKKATNGGSWTTVATFSNWKPYDNSIQDIDIKAALGTINILINGNLVGTASRSDSWTAGGNVGFDRGGWNQTSEGGSNSTDGISPIWVTNNYVGAEPVVTFVGNTDITIKRVMPTADASAIGLNVIEYTPQTQILEDNVDGDTLGRYVYNGYPAATPTKQIFKSAITIRNRGTATDTFTIKLTNTGTTSQWSTAFDQDGSGYANNLPGSGGTPTAGSVTLAGGASTVITVLVIPSASALFEGAYGRLVTDIAVTSTSDYSFDYARLLFNINGKSGCYWKYSLPISVNYTNTYGTGSLVDYQVQVNLANFDFTAARSDGADVIFTDANGTALSFAQKSFNRGTSATTGTASYWVKVHKLAAGTTGSTTTTTINMWWGNANYSPSRSSKSATFDLWEDWERAEYSSTAPATIAGCPDGTTAPSGYNCSGQSADPNGWKNFPTPADNYNWWKIGSGVLDGKSVMADKGSTNTSSDIGPMLAGGDVRWKSYEASYSFYDQYDNYNTGYGNPQFNPVYYQDSGNSWGIELFKADPPGGLFIFRPFASGTDWTWTYQANVYSNLGNWNFPAQNTRYWVKVRLFQNPADSLTHLKLFISPKSSSASSPVDTDSDTDFMTITPTTASNGGGFVSDPAFTIQGGEIGFGGWNGGFSYDNIRVRKYVEPEPVCSNGTTAPTSYTPITSLSTPVLTAPLLNGRSVLLDGFLSTFTWTGDLQAVYADCFVAGDCQSGEDATKLGTISLWGKVDDTTPKGFGDQLKSAVAGDNNRTTINDPSWQTNGRYIFTAYDSNSDGKISCTTTPADCIALGTTNAGVLSTYLGYSEASPYAQTTNLIKYVRGQYVAGTGFARSDVRNQCSSGTADTCQWKLGDITHSSPLVVGVPNMLYADPAYDVFRASNTNREMVAYAGSNDGMLHAVRMSSFNATTQKYTTDSTATELWAFVPNALLPVLSSTADNYHEYTNDGLLRAIDIKSTTTQTYKTVLVGGLRSGGQSLYAMDITDPRAANLMWEINNSTNATEFTKIGKTWSAPALGRLCETTPCDSSNTTNRWVAIIGSGFSPNSVTNLSKTAYITIVNLETGGIIQQINVSAKLGNLTTNLGIQRDKYGYIQRVNFGDYYGALWRLDLTTPAKVSAMLDTVNKTVLSTTTDMLFKPSDYATSNVTDAANLPQWPITTQPTTAYAVNSSGTGFWWVYFGTGAYDAYNSSYPYQKIYALKDTVSTPYVDSNLTDMTNTTATNSAKNSWFIGLGQTDTGNRDYQYSGSTTSACVTNCGNQGYSASYCASACQDVGTSTKDRNERVVSSPTVYGGFLFVNTYTPDSTVCGAGSGRFYALSYETGSYNGGLLLLGNKTDGRSLLLSTGGSPTTPIVYTGKNGKGQIIGAGLQNSSSGGLSKILLNPSSFSQTGINLLLWRRVR